jgi:hypothetical protein
MASQPFLNDPYSQASAIAIISFDFLYFGELVKPINFFTYGVFSFPSLTSIPVRSQMSSPAVICCKDHSTGILNPISIAATFFKQA